MIYYILNIRDLNDVTYSEVMEDSANTVRKNLATTEFVVKSNNIPKFISNESVTPISTLNYVQTISLMRTNIWSEED